MLRQFVNDWSSAKENATILEEAKNGIGTIVHQKAELNFLGTKIHLITNLIPGTDDYTNEFFVPSTLALIKSFPETPYPVSEFIVTIMEAIDPESRSLAKDAKAKRDDAIDKFMDIKKEEWSGILSAGAFTEDEITFLVNYTFSQLKRDRVDNLDLFIRLLDKYQDKLFDDSVCVEKQNGDIVRKSDIIYDTLCRCANRRIMAEESRFTVSGWAVNIAFGDSANDDRIPEFVKDAKMVLRAIFKDCREWMNIFSSVARNLAEFYAFRTNEPVPYRMAKVQERQNSIKNRRKSYVSASAMLGDVSAAFESAKPMKKKKSSK